MLLQDKNKCIDHDPDLVLVCSLNLANMDAKEQADRMAAAEALYMISTRGSKGRGAVTLPRKSKRGRKAKKPRSDFEEGDNLKSNEGKVLNNVEGGVGVIIKKRHRGREGETAEQVTNSPRSRSRSSSRDSTAYLVSKGRGRGNRSKAEKSSHAEKSALTMPTSDKGKINLTGRIGSIDAADDKSEFLSGDYEIESDTVADSVEIKSRSGRGSGKRSRSRGGQAQKAKRTSSNSPVSAVRPPLKSKAGRPVRRKSPGSESSLESLSVFPEDKKSVDNLQSKPPPKKLGRFREKSAGRKNSNEISDDDSKTEIQALGFTGVAVTLVKTLPSKGSKVVSQRKMPVSGDGSNKVVQVSATSANISSTGSGANISFTSPPSLPSFTSEVVNLPSLPVGIESLQLPSIPMPNLSSLSGLKAIKSAEIQSEKAQAQKESEKAQKVLPLKKRKLHSQKEKEEKALEDGSDIESEEAYGDQGINSPSTPSQPQIQTKFTVQAHPIITMQTLMEINTALTPDEDGDLPLHIAVVHENMRMVTKLINLMKIAVKGVDKFNKQQQTPLHLAVKLNFLPAVALLISSGASVNTVDSTGSSAIHMAVQGRFYKCLKHMLHNCPEAEVNARNFEGLSPLHLAVDNKDLEQVELLLKYDADIDLADGKSGRTALFHAAETNQKPMVELLLKKGANPDLPNYAGVTTTMAAQGRSLHSILKLIGSVTQEIKWSFVTMKSNPESQSEMEKTSDTPLVPSVEVYSGKSLLHSELLKPSGLGVSETNGEKSKVYQSMLLVKNGTDEKVKQNSSLKLLKKPQSRSLAEVKKELDSHKGDEVKSSGTGSSTADTPSLYRVKQEIIDSTEATPLSSNTSSHGGGDAISYKTPGNRESPYSLDRNVAQLNTGMPVQPSIDGKHSPMSPSSCLAEEQKPRSSQSPHPHPRQNNSDKHISSPSLSPASPRTPPSSTLDSVTFTSMQARLYKKLLDMYNIKTCISQMTLNTPSLKSLPAFPTQPFPSSLAPTCQATITNTSVSSQPTSPQRINSSPTIPYRRSLSNHIESEQQTYVVQRNPVQRISVLPTPRDTLVTRSDSPAFHGQGLVRKMSPHASSIDMSEETDPDVPLNLSSKISLKEGISPIPSSYTAASGYHTFPKSDQMTTLSTQKWPIGVPADAQKTSGIPGSANSPSSMLNLTHHSQLINSGQKINMSQNGDKNKNFLSSTATDHVKETTIKTREGSSFIVTDLPHITNSVSPQTASLVRTFLAHNPIRSESPSSKLPASSFSVLSSSVSSPQISHPSPKELSALNISLTSASSLPIISSIAASETGQRYIAVTSSEPCMRPVCGPIMDVSRGAAVSDPQFLHQGRIIDLSQSEENLEASKFAHLCTPPAGKIVGFSGAILSLSPPSRNAAQEDRRHEKLVQKDVPAAKVTKKRGRKSGKYSQNLSDSSEITANKINNETDQKLKKFLGLKKIDPTFLNIDRPETPEAQRSESKKIEGSKSSVVETVGLFSGNIQQVKVGKPQSPSLSSKTLLSKPSPHIENSKLFPQTSIVSGSSSSSPQVRSKSKQSHSPLSDLSEELTELKRCQDSCVTSSSGGLSFVESESISSETTKCKGGAFVKDNIKPSKELDITHNSVINPSLEVPVVSHSELSEMLKMTAQSSSTNFSPGSVQTCRLDQSRSKSLATKGDRGEESRGKRHLDSALTNSHYETSKHGNAHDQVSEFTNDPDPKGDLTDSPNFLTPQSVTLQLGEFGKSVPEKHLTGGSDLFYSDSSECDTRDTAAKEYIHITDGRSELKCSQNDDEHHDLVIDLGPGYSKLGD